MKDEANEVISKLHSMPSYDINVLALELLHRLLDTCTINLVSKITGITRPTLYRWLDPEVDYEAMNSRDAAWFVLVYYTSPKVAMLIERGPATYPRLASRIIEEGNEDNA